jgi:hypothetical protein
VTTELLIEGVPGAIVALLALRAHADRRSLKAEVLATFEAAMRQDQQDGRAAETR